MSGAIAKRALVEDGVANLEVFATVWPETTPTLGITPVLGDEAVLVLARKASPSLEPAVADRKTAPGAAFRD